MRNLGVKKVTQILMLAKTATKATKAVSLKAFTFNENLQK